MKGNDDKVGNEYLNEKIIRCSKFKKNDDLTYAYYEDDTHITLNDLISSYGYYNSSKESGNIKCPKISNGHVFYYDFRDLKKYNEKHGKGFLESVTQKGEVTEIKYMKGKTKQDKIESIKFSDHKGHTYDFKEEGFYKFGNDDKTYIKINKIKPEKNYEMELYSIEYDKYIKNGDKLIGPDPGVK